MKLTEFNLEAGLSNRPSAVDLDVTARLGPEISRHIEALETLLKIMPNSSTMISKLYELKEVMAGSMPAGVNVLEQAKVIGLYSSLYPKFGESTWWAVSKELKEQGYEKSAIDSVIDQTVSLV